MQEVNMFTKQQLEQLARKHNIPLEEFEPYTEDNSLPVRDGRVKKTDRVYWHGMDVLEYKLAEISWENIKAFPNVYSIGEPNYILLYAYNPFYETVKEQLNDF